MFEKFSVGRLLRVDRFAEGYYKFKNSMVGGFKNSQIFRKEIFKRNRNKKVEQSISKDHLDNLRILEMLVSLNF